MTAAKIADSAVTTAKIADEAVTEAKLADGAVTEGKITKAAVGAKLMEICNPTNITSADFSNTVIAFLSDASHMGGKVYSSDDSSLSAGWYSSGTYGALSSSGAARVKYLYIPPTVTKLQDGWYSGMTSLANVFVATAEDDFTVGGLPTDWTVQVHYIGWVGIWARILGDIAINY